MQFYLGSRRVSLSPVLLATGVFLFCLTIAGGASRSDVAGQAIVRFVAWSYLATFVVLGARPSEWRGRPVLYLLMGALALVLIQLMPLPPALWAQLPGRAVFAPASDLGGATWRPLALVPSTAINAAYSLVVPAAAFALMAVSHQSEDRRLVALLVGLIFATSLVGLVQLAGASLSNPFVNDSADASGTFANRNHFALFLALGCLLAPVWAFHERRTLTWRAFAAFALVPFFFLMILASGSRAGILVGVIGCVGGGMIVFGNARAALRRHPRWIAPTLLIGFLILVALLVLISTDGDRAAGITRLMALDVSEEVRGRALPTVIKMVSEYFPVGAGFGGFDPLFRLHEPDSLLKPTYLNRVHNDLIEVVLDGGFAAALLLLAGLGWWLFATARAWRSAAGGTLGKLGSMMILLILVASLFDYPARAPMIMALLVIAGVWLSQAADEATGSHLLRKRRDS